MRFTKLLFGAVLLVVLCVSCAEDRADIKELYNSGDSFNIRFSNWESLDRSSLQDSDDRFPGAYFKYSKKNDMATIVFADARKISFVDVRYNKLQSDDSQTCLQNNKIRFVIMNNGDSYSLKMFYCHYFNLYPLAYFEDGKEESKDDTFSGIGIGINYLGLLLVVILLGILIWGIVKKNKIAIIIPCLIGLAIFLYYAYDNYNEKRRMLAIQNTETNNDSIAQNDEVNESEPVKSEEVKEEPIVQKEEIKERIAIDSLYVSSDNGYTRVYESPDVSSTVIGSLRNDDKYYPVYSTEGPWYEIEYHGAKGYVYERDCVLQSGMGDI